MSFNVVVATSPVSPNGMVNVSFGTPRVVALAGLSTVKPSFG